MTAHSRWSIGPIMHRNQIELWGIKSTSGNFRPYQIQTANIHFNRLVDYTLASANENREVQEMMSELHSPWFSAEGSRQIVIFDDQNSSSSFPVFTSVSFIHHGFQLKGFGQKVIFTGQISFCWNHHIVSAGSKYVLYFTEKYRIQNKYKFQNK